MTEAPLSPGAKLRLALEMFEDGVALMRQNLRRRMPGASEVEIEDALRTWLSTRPGAEHGDSYGRPRDLPRDPSEPAA